MRLIASLLKVWYRVSCFCIACTWSSYHVLQFLYLLHGRTLHSTKKQEQNMKIDHTFADEFYNSTQTRPLCLSLINIFLLYDHYITSFFPVLLRIQRTNEKHRWSSSLILGILGHFICMWTLQTHYSCAAFFCVFLLLLTWVSGPACAHLD